MEVGPVREGESQGRLNVLHVLSGECDAVPEEDCGFAVFEEIGGGGWLSGLTLSGRAQRCAGVGQEEETEGNAFCEAFGAHGF